MDTEEVTANQTPEQTPEYPEQINEKPEMENEPGGMFDEHGQSIDDIPGDKYYGHEEGVEGEDEQDVGEDEAPTGQLGGMYHQEGEQSQEQMDNNEAGDQLEDEESTIDED